MLFELAFLVCLTLLLSIFVWLCLKGVGKERRFKIVLIVNVIVVVMCSIVYFVLLITGYEMIAPIVTGLIYLILIKIVLDLRLFDALLVLFFSSFASSIILYIMSNLIEVGIFIRWSNNLLRLVIGAGLVDYMLKNYHSILEPIYRLINKPLNGNY